MILATHAITGAAVGRMSSNPLVAFVLGFLSHFVLDAIPHWQYELISKTQSSNPLEEDMALDRRFVRDFALLSFDCLSGILFSLLIFQGASGFSNPSLTIFFGSLGGVLPDALQFAFWKIRREPLTTFQKFHEWIHAEWDFDYKSKIGVATQIIFAAAVILLSKILVN